MKEFLIEQKTMPLTEKHKLKKILKPYQDKINLIIEQRVPTLGPESELRDACLYALLGRAKRFRPSITLMIGQALKPSLDLSLAALSIELFHTASLVADDLPLMDDDEFRRDQKSTHCVYGSDVALLASYALMGMGYQCIDRIKKELASSLSQINERALHAFSLLANCNGLDGAPLGQLVDLKLKTLSLQQIDELFYRKTILFFEAAFEFGWLFAGGDLNEIELVKKAAYHFGFAFQIYDDFNDLKQDKEKERYSNYPLLIGEEKAQKACESHIRNCEEALKKLNLYNENFQEMLSFLTNGV